MGWQMDHRLVPFSGLNSTILKNKNEMERNGKLECHICHWIFSLIVHQRRMEKLDERVVEKIE
jgi:hypothetical protein